MIQGNEGDCVSRAMGSVLRSKQTTLSVLRIYEAVKPGEVPLWRLFKVRIWPKINLSRHRRHSIRSDTFPP